MSDYIKHECGIALIRLLKPLNYYLEKYDAAFYGIDKMYILMEKQHNRGQDGAGIASIKMNLKPGHAYINRVRSNSANAIKDVFEQIHGHIKQKTHHNPALLKNAAWLKENVDFTGELFLGHLRYGTHGSNYIENIHPVARENNWMTRNLVLAGNFHLTNIDELFERLLRLGQYPTATADTVTVLERIGHFLDMENEELYREIKNDNIAKIDVTRLLADKLSVQRVLAKAASRWDGGYVMAGMIGHGDAFVMRDPNGIRPAFYYHDDEIIVAASERAVIQTTLNVSYESIKELTPGHVLIIKHHGAFSEEPFIEPQNVRPCAFERIYFSRGSDQDIYKERKQLGKLLIPSILKAVDYDIEHTVFSHIPNTAESAYLGMVEGLHEYCNKVKAEKIMAEKAPLSNEKLNQILSFMPRVEKVAIKDVKLRTFITQDNERDHMTAHVYDITYGSVQKDIDNLVIIDDSIVRGTTLRQSIIRILDRLSPKKIVIASSAPQIRYPDCYGIDMSRMEDFIAFKATIALLKETDRSHIIDEVYKEAKAQVSLPKEEVVNSVRKIYAPLTAEEISKKIAALVTGDDVRAEIEIVFQSIENLHQAIKVHNGDWYFTGNYPTPGGNVVANKSFINFYENADEKAY